MKPLQVTYSDGHIPALDGLRGVAALVVVLFHFFTHTFPFGWMGVDLFFVLSGFLITGILLRTKDSPNYYKNYIAKRVLRIFPLYYFFLILFFIVFPLIGISRTIQDYDYLSSIQTWYWLYIQNWLIFFDPVYPGYEIITHFWSLAIEEQFYIFWPFVIYFTPRDKVFKVCISLILLSIIVRLVFQYYYEFRATEIYVFTFARLDALAVGSCLAAMARNDGQVKSINKYAPVVFILAGLYIVVKALSHSSFDVKYFTTIGYTIVAIFFGSALMIVTSNHSGNIFKKIAETGILKFFGKYSYGLYVYHIPVLRIFPKYLKPWIGNKIVMLVICIILSIVIAYLSYHLIEKHFLKLKSKFHPDEAKPVIKPTEQLKVE